MMCGDANNLENRRPVTSACRYTCAAFVCASEHYRLLAPCLHLGLDGACPMLRANGSSSLREAGAHLHASRHIASVDWPYVSSSHEPQCIRQ